MSPGDESSLAGKVFHFNVKDHVTRDLLVPNWDRLIIGKDFEGNANVLHFLGNAIGPKGIAQLLIDSEGFLDGLRQLNAKFMGPFEVSGITPLNLRDNPVAFL